MANLGLRRVGLHGCGGEWAEREEHTQDVVVIVVMVVVVVMKRGRVVVSAKI